jgi:hypothetical protein
MVQAISGARRPIVRIAAGAWLLVLALIDAAIVALFTFLVTRTTAAAIRIGEVLLLSDDGYNGAAVFLLLCLLSGYAGLALICRWRDAAFAAQAAGWATIALCVYGLWLYLNMLVPGLPHFPISIGISMPPSVSLAFGVIGLFVIWATRNPTEKNPEKVHDT